MQIFDEYTSILRKSKCSHCAASSQAIVQQPCLESLREIIFVKCYENIFWRIKCGHKLQQQLCMPTLSVHIRWHILWRARVKNGVVLWRLYLKGQTTGKNRAKYIAKIRRKKHQDFNFLTGSERFWGNFEKTIFSLTF